MAPVPAPLPFAPGPRCLPSPCAPRVMILSLWLLRFMPGLPRIIMLVMLAFLIETATAHRKLRLASAPFRGLAAAIVLRARGLLLDLPCIGNIRFPFQDAQLLLVRLLSLLRRPSWTAFPIVLRRATAPISNLGFIDPALRIGIVFDIAFEGVRAFEFLQFVRRYSGHRRSLGAPDQRITNKIDVRRTIQFHMIGAHDLSFEAHRSSGQFASGSLRLSLLPPGSGHRDSRRLLLQ